MPPDLWFHGTKDKDFSPSHAFLKRRHEVAGAPEKRSKRTSGSGHHTKWC